MAFPFVDKCSQRVTHYSQNSAGRKSCARRMHQPERINGDRIHVRMDGGYRRYGNHGFQRVAAWKGGTASVEGYTP